MRAELTRAGADISLRNVTKRYGIVDALDDVSIEIESGEFVTFLGPSGSGKTTTLGVIAGFESVTRGEVLLGGVRVNDVKPSRRNIGMVFQHYALFPHMTVRENIEFPLRARKFAQTQRRTLVDAALESVALERLADRQPRELSGGQQQRVALARALVYTPPILLLDEPLGALDKHLRENLQGQLKRIHREVGSTFVFVTHDQEESLALSDRIAVFNRGRVEQIAPPETLYQQPATKFVAEFMGESNVFSGEASPRGVGAWVLESDGDVFVGRGDISRGPAALIVRPDAVDLTSAPPAGDVLNVVEGVVKDNVYLGASRKLEVATRSGRNAYVRSESTRNGEFRPGDPCYLSWRPEHGVLVPSPESVV